MYIHLQLMDASDNLSPSETHQFWLQVVLISLSINAP